MGSALAEVREGTVESFSMRDLSQTPEICRTVEIIGNRSWDVNPELTLNMPLVQ